MPVDKNTGQDTETRITKAVFHLMKDTSIPRITVGDVVKQAKVSRSTFYRHFDSVDDVVKRFEERHLNTMRQINEAALKLSFTSAELQPTASMIARMETIMECRDEVIALNGPNGDPQFAHKVTAFMYDYLHDRTISIPGDKRYRDMYLTFIIAGHNAFIQYWLEHRPDVTPKRAAAMLCRIYYSPFFLSEDSMRQSPSSTLF